MKFLSTVFCSVLFLVPASAISEVVINELNYDPIDIDNEGGSVREFIELYNPGPGSVDLSGYSFSTGITFTFPGQTMVEEDTYVVLARIPTHSIWRGNPSPVIGPYERKLSNGGERIILARPDGSVVDQLEYDDDFPWARGADGYGPSLERISWNLPTDDFHSWRASFQDGGTPGRENSVVETLPRPFIHSFEISPQFPTSSDDVTVRVNVDTPELIAQAFLQWEKIESTTTATTQGIIENNTWKYWKGTAPPSSGLEWTVANFDDSSWEEGRSGFGYGYPDQVNTELVDMRGNYITTYLRHSFQSVNPGSLGMLSLRIVYDDGFICYINGKEVLRRFAPESYSNNSRATRSLLTTESETVELGRASDLLVSGENVISLVGFNASYNGSDFVLAPTFLSSTTSNGTSQVPMEFDRFWNEGETFQATIPAQPNQSLIRFNVKLELTNGNQLILPYITERRPFESYFVYDNDIPSNLPILWFFPETTTYITEVTTGFSGIAVKPLGNDPVQVFDGATITPSRNGHKVKFLKGEEFRGDRTINLSLESPREGTTAGGQSPHVEEISYKIFRDFGVLTPRCDWYRVIENNTHSQRIAVQQPNERFLEINDRNPDGNIYKIAYNEPGGYSKKSNLDEGDEDYRELFQQVNIRNQQTLADDIKQYLMYEEIINYNVASFLLSHWDGIKNNIFLYHDLEPEGKWEIIPWDVDKTFGYTDSNPMYWEMPIDFFITLKSPGSTELTSRNLDGPIMRPFHSIPQYHQDFVARVEEALNGLFSIERVGGMIDETENLLLADLNMIEQYKGSTNTRRRNQITTSYDTMRFFLVNRHAFLQTQLPTDFTVERSVPATVYQAGEEIPGFQITISALNNSMIQATVTENIPNGFVLSNIQTSHGTTTISGNTLLWNTVTVTDTATLSYSLTAPDTNPPIRITLNGSIRVDGLDYQLTETELRFLPDNVRDLDPEWVIGAAGTWTIVDGVLNAYSESSYDPKHAWVNLELGTNDYTVKADVRMLDWMDHDLARSGIAVRVDPNDGERALNLLFHNDQNSIDMLSDLVVWGAFEDYQWETGEWYTMTLNVTGNRLEGEFFKTGTNENPQTILWDDPIVGLFRASGYPGLTASTLEGLTSQFDNFEVIVDGEVVFFDDFNEDSVINAWEIH